jgi:hypothetical protein
MFAGRSHRRDASPHQRHQISARPCRRHPVTSRVASSRAAHNVPCRASWMRRERNSGSTKNSVSRSVPSFDGAIDGRLGQVVGGACRSVGPACPNPVPDVANPASVPADIVCIRTPFDRENSSNMGKFSDAASSAWVILPSPGARASALRAATPGTTYDRGPRRARRGGRTPPS